MMLSGSNCLQSSEQAGMRGLQQQSPVSEAELHDASEEGVSW